MHPPSAACPISAPVSRSRWAASKRGFTDADAAFYVDAQSLLDMTDVGLATEQVLAGAYPEFELGVVPPLPAGGDRVLIDRDLCENEWVVLEAGTHAQSVRLETRDLVDLGNAKIVDLTQN